MSCSLKRMSRSPARMSRSSARRNRSLERTGCSPERTGCSLERTSCSAAPMNRSEEQKSRSVRRARADQIILRPGGEQVDAFSLTPPSPAGRGWTSGRCSRDVAWPVADCAAGEGSAPSPSQSPAAPIGSDAAGVAPSPSGIRLLAFDRRSIHVSCPQISSDRRQTKPFPTTPKTLGDYIQLKRFEKGLTRKQVALVTGGLRSVVRLWEWDICLPSATQWEALSSLLNLDDCNSS